MERTVATKKSKKFTSKKYEKKAQKWLVSLRSGKYPHFYSNLHAYNYSETDVDSDSGSTASGSGEMVNGPGRLPIWGINSSTVFKRGCL